MAGVRHPSAAHGTQRSHTTGREQHRRLQPSYAVTPPARARPTRGGCQYRADHGSRKSAPRPSPSYSRDTRALRQRVQNHAVATPCAASSTAERRSPPAAACKARLVAAQAHSAQPPTAS
jgi:hypothetical protein